MSDTFKKCSESISNKNKSSYYDPPYDLKYNANGTWKKKNKKKQRSLL